MRFHVASALAFLAVNFAATAHAEDRDNKPDDLWLRTPSHVHAGADVRHSHRHYHHHQILADIPQYSLASAFNYTSYSGPVAAPSATQSTATMTITDATGGQLSLQLERDQTAGLTDHTASALFRVPLTTRLSISGGATFSAERSLNPAYRLNVAPGYLLFSSPKGQQIFGQLSVSAETSRFDTSDAFSLNPMVTVGSRANRIMLSAGYMLGYLYNAKPAAAFWSTDQASATTGLTLSVFWSVNRQLSLAMTAMPYVKTSTLFSSSDSSLVRVSGSYRFRNGPRLGLAVEHMDTSSDGVFLNRALTVEASLSVGF